jgi:hypothetical protein
LTPETKYTAELLDGIYKTSVLYGLGLVMTAIIQTFQNQLDLYHAIFVMQSIFSLNFVYEYGKDLHPLERHSQHADGACGVGQRKLIRVPPSKRDFRMKIFSAVQTFSTVAFTAWLLYVWIKDSNFGSQPECNHLVKYVLVFVNVRATAPGLRVVFIVYLVVSAITILSKFGAIVSVSMQGLRKDIHDKVREVVRPTTGRSVPARQDRTRAGTASGTRQIPISVNLSVM